MATRSDVEGLRIVEAHIAELSDQIERTRSQLSRLDDIERQLAQLGHAFSDEELIRLLGGVVPTETDLVRFAEEAASRVASRMSAEPARMSSSDSAGALQFVEAAHAAQATASRQMQSLQELLTSYMDERRRGEAHTADALETMQQAMQHMLDRVDAIENQRATLPMGLDSRPAPMGVESGYDQRPVTPSPSRTFAEEAKAAARLAAQAPPASRLAARTEANDRIEPRLETPIRPPAPRAGASTEALAAQIAAAAPRPATSDDIETELVETARPDRPADSKPADRQAFIAMARRAAEQAKADVERNAGAPSSAAKGKSTPSVDAAVASVSLKDRLLGNTAGEGKNNSRTGLLVVASLGVILLAGFWTISGKKLSILRSAPVIEQSSPQAIPKPAAQKTTPSGPAIDTEAVPATPGADKPDAAAQEPEAQPKRRRSVPETGVDDLGAAPKSGDRQTSLQMPGAPPATQHVGMGIAIEQVAGPAPIEAVMRARQEQHLASLSQRTALDAARSSALPDPAAQGAQQREATTIELPPAAVGPLSLRLAAGKGDASAQFDVAARIAEGRGVKQDFAQAAVWYQRAATQGLAQAQYRLAALYERGLGVTEDPARARVWYKRAAEQGNLKAMHNLAVISAGRPGVAPDYVAAIHWFQEAAERGLSDSQFNLGVLAESGLGMDQDLVGAYKWFSLAARSGDKEATRRRDLLTAKLDEQQVAAGNAAVAAWRPRPVDRMANDPRAAGDAWKRTAGAQ